ncbi:MAG: hypothetical protein JXR91_16800 [Deltaproteobacteria bacterium]|nr:hypothetical protein [Deltaproteobacteria bacterium]
MNTTNSTVNINSNKFWVGTVVLLISILFVIENAYAQDLEKPELRQGYYFQAVPLLSTSVVKSEGETYGFFPGTGFYLRMGESLFNWLDIGIGGSAAWDYSDKYKHLHGHFSLEGTINPVGNLYATLSAGLGFSDFTRRVKGEDNIIGRFGGNYNIAIGYDIFLGHHKKYQSGGFAVSPVIGVQIGPSSTTDTYSFYLGIGLTYWTGRDKNKLDLPVDNAY